MKRTQKRKIILAAWIIIEEHLKPETKSVKIHKKKSKDTRQKSIKKTELR